MMKQKHSFIGQERELKERSEGDFRVLEELKTRVDHSAKALERLTKENIILRKDKDKLEKLIQDKEQDYSKKIVTAMEEMRESDRKLRKKVKKLAKEKKELQFYLKNTQDESSRLKEYFGQLIGDLEIKLKEMIHANQSLTNEFAFYKEEQLNVMHNANSEL